MLQEFEDRLANFIEANELFGSSGKVLLAVSGGADSIALIYAMAALKAEGVFGVELHCAHINHNLRGEESDSDVEFVVAEASKLGVGVTVRGVDVRGFAAENKLSIETAGRQLRIESLVDIARANNCDCVATGHHKDDNAETMLQRLSRGTGFRGLCGIWPVQEFEGIRFLRPLLCVSREEIVGYLKERGLGWREDSTNQQCRYRRNFIRHRLIPELQKQSGQCVAEGLFELSVSARGFYDLICKRAEKVWGKLAECKDERVELDLEKFSSEHPEVRVELVRQGLTQLGCGEGDLTQGHYEKVLEICEQKTSGKKIELPGGFLAGCEYGKLVISKGGKGKGERVSEIVELKIPGKTKFGEYLAETAFLEVRDVDIEKFKKEKDKFVEWFDFDKLSLPLQIRYRRQGDKFRPLGAKGEKRVGKFLTADKVAYEVRERLLVVCDSERIIWLWPVRVSEDAKVTKATRRVLQIKIDQRPQTKDQK